MTEVSRRYVVRGVEGTKDGPLVPGDLSVMAKPEGVASAAVTGTIAGKKKGARVATGSCIAAGPAVTGVAGSTARAACSGVTRDPLAAVATTAVAGGCVAAGPAVASGAVGPAAVARAVASLPAGPAAAVTVSSGGTGKGTAASGSTPSSAVAAVAAARATGAGHCVAAGPAVAAAAGSVSTFPACTASAASSAFPAVSTVAAGAAFTSVPRDYVHTQGEVHIRTGDSSYAIFFTNNLRRSGRYHQQGK